MLEDTVRCPACGGNDHSPVFRDWHTCRGCGACFRKPMPTQDEMAAIHKDSFSRPSRAASQMRATSEYLARCYARLLTKAVPIESFSGVRLLDFGAGFGDTAAYLSSLGAEVTAIEPFGFEFCRKRGLPVYRTLAELTADAGPKARFGGVIMIEVLEHLSRPIPLMRKLRDTLVEGGWLFLATPNNQGAKARLLRGMWGEVRKGGHVVLHSPASVRAVLQAASFGSISISRRAVTYSSNPFRRLLQDVLQITGLGGQLKVIARR